MPRQPNSSECMPAAPRKQVLLLTCMDLRLLDDTVAFMDEFNLANRYDQISLAGAALGVMELSSPPANGSSRATHASWRDVFFHHLNVAINVLGRKIKDIFILEHRDCGAYEHFHPTHNEPYEQDEDGQDLEEKHHREQALALAAEISKYCNEQRRKSLKAAAHARRAKKPVDESMAQKRAEAWKDIRVSCFLMDLRGNVKPLCEEQRRGKGARRKKRARNRKG